MGIRNASLSSLCYEKNNSASEMISGGWHSGSELMRQQDKAREVN